MAVEAPKLPLGLVGGAQKNRIRASLILVHYDQANDLKRCLRSINMAEQREMEIIVIDNKSVPDSLAYLTDDFPEVRLITSSTNLGFAGGCNLGAEVSAGPILVFLNPDTVVTPKWSNRLLVALESDPEIGLTTPKILLLDQKEIINTAGNEIHLSGLTLCRGANLPGDALSEPAELSAVSGAAFAIRKELFQLIGGFDEDYFMYMEDTDLSWRARLAGYRCQYVPESIIRHQYSLRFRPNKTFFQERNRYLTLIKNLHWGSLVLLLPVLALAELVTWGYVLLQARQQWKDKLRAYLWLVDHWQEVLKKRAAIQKLRKRHDHDLLSLHTFQLDYGQTGQGWPQHLAHWIFDPLFYLLGRLALALIRW